MPARQTTQSNAAPVRLCCAGASLLLPVACKLSRCATEPGLTGIVTRKLLQWLIRMKLTRNELLLFTTPLLVIAFVFLLGAINNYIIKQEEQAQLRPSLDPNGSIIVVRRLQPDGSIKEFAPARDAPERLLTVRPAHTINRRGLFQMRYLVLGAASFVALLLLPLPVLVVSAWLRRKGNQTS